MRRADQRSREIPLPCACDVTLNFREDPQCVSNIELPRLATLDNVGPDLAGCRGMGCETGAALCLGGRERSRFYSVYDPAMINILLTNGIMVNERGFDRRPL